MMTNFWSWFHVFLMLLALALVIRHELTKHRHLVFFTMNKGRTFWYQGKEMRASKLTDQLQTAYTKHTTYKGSGIEWRKEDFYDDNE